MGKIIIVFLIGIGVGVWVAHQDAKVTKQEIAVEKVQDHSEVKENKIVIERIKPDGTVIRKIVSSTDTRADVKKEAVQAKTEIVDRTKSWYAGAMVSTSFSSPVPVYGVQVHKNILGPFSAGIFLLTNKSAGVTIGMSF